MGYLVRVCKIDFWLHGLTICILYRCVFFWQCTVQYYKVFFFIQFQLFLKATSCTADYIDVFTLSFSVFEFRCLIKIRIWRNWFWQTCKKSLTTKSTLAVSFCARCHCLAKMNVFRMKCDLPYFSSMWNFILHHRWICFVHKIAVIFGRLSGQVSYKAGKKFASVF